MTRSMLKNFAYRKGGGGPLRLLKLKAPKPPRSLYGNWLHWILGIKSPSRMFMASMNPTPEEAGYFSACVDYEMYVIACKVESRTCTRQEWDRLRLLKYRRRMEARHERERREMLQNLQV